MFNKISLVNNIAKSTDLRSAPLAKKRLRHSCFRVNRANLLGAHLLAASVSLVKWCPQSKIKLFYIIYGSQMTYWYIIKIYKLKVLNVFREYKIWFTQKLEKFCSFFLNTFLECHNFFVMHTYYTDVQSRRLHPWLWFTHRLQRYTENPVQHRRRKVLRK